MEDGRTDALCSIPRHEDQFDVPSNSRRDAAQVSRNAGKLPAVHVVDATRRGIILDHRTHRTGNVIDMHQVDEREAIARHEHRAARFDPREEPMFAGQRAVWPQGMADPQAGKREPVLLEFALEQMLAADFACAIGSRWVHLVVVRDRGLLGHGLQV